MATPNVVRTPAEKAKTRNVPRSNWAVPTIPAGALGPLSL